MRGKGIHPLVNQQFSYVRLVAPLLDTAAISTEFFGVISTQFCFTFLSTVLCHIGYMLGFATLF